MKALENIKILDLTRLLPGPYASMILADFGAEVIKIEEPEKGDYARYFSPFINGISSSFIILNRNKKSLTLDLKKPEGKEIFLKLIKDADVVMEGFRPGVMKRLCLDYKTLKKINPKIIFCSLTGYGQKGPYMMDAAHDINYLSLAGITNLSGNKDNKPAISGVQIADISSGLMAVIGILTAIQSRQNTGVGQFIDVSLFNSSLALTPFDASHYFANGQTPERGESFLSGGLANYNIYKAKDGRFMAIGALEMKFWKNFCVLIEREDLIPYAEMPEKKEDLTKILENIFMSKTSLEWVEFVEGKDTCITIAKTIEETFNDPHVLKNEMIVDMYDEKIKNYKQIGFPIKLSNTPATFSKFCPELGENNKEILESIGYTKEYITKLKNEKII